MQYIQIEWHTKIEIKSWDVINPSDTGHSQNFLPMQALFNLDITVPDSSYKVLTNTEISGPVQMINKKSVKHNFRTSPKMSTYLIAICVGHPASYSSPIQGKISNSKAKYDFSQKSLSSSSSICAFLIHFLRILEMVQIYFWSLKSLSICLMINDRVSSKMSTPFFGSYSKESSQSWTESWNWDMPKATDADIAFIKLRNLVKLLSLPKKKKKPHGFTWIVQSDY